MKVFPAVLLLILGTALLQTPAKAQSRKRQSFDTGWKFKLDSNGQYQQPAVNDAGWRVLNLPHDWSIEGKFSPDHPANTGGGALPGGIGWYRKSFTLTAADQQQVFIEFDGVYRNSEVWINGHYLGKRANGYLSFHYELTPYLYTGGRPNVLAVKVDNSLQPNSRWYSGSGIYRHVWLTTVNRIHIDHWGVFARTPMITKDSARVAVETKVRNNRPRPVELTLRTRILDKEGKAVASDSRTVKALPGVAVAVVPELRVDNPSLWSVDDPYCYQVESVISEGGRTLDSNITSLGIRHFRFDRQKGFFLNDQPLKIRGVCNHHDLGALGAAMNTRALERQLEILKEMGCNGIRTSHNPPAPELLELCDKMGFIVMDEAFDMWRKGKNPYDYSLNWDEDHYRDLRDQVLRDRNHPSVFIWSVGNEISEQWGDTSGRVIARELVAIVRYLDSTRPVVTANNEVEPTNQLVQSGAFDLIGFNYHHADWAGFPDKYPTQSLIITESVSALETRGHYDKVPFDTIRRWPERWDLPVENANPDWTVSAYDHVSAPWGSTHEETLRLFEKYDHVSGMYIWTGFDYLGEPTPYPWPARSSYFGIIDLAGFPKDVYYLYQSVWTNKPVLHLLPHWNWQKGDTLDVVAYYSQAEEVELFLNGQSLGSRRKNGDTLHVKWRVPFQPGRLKAISRKNGQAVLTKEVSTAGQPAKLLLQADRNNIKADGRDLSFVTVTIVDAAGVRVPDAGHLVRYKVSGKGFLAGVDSGSPTSHESFKGNQHTAMNGLGLAILQSGRTSGAITLTASVDGLPPASITVQAR
ncbi:MAG: glycoside hydrolase family 2 TIM barrel-domain containing protein [Candidatus Pseudobacter hemicellulosilyticus]|uniref:Glycoside hydrolase family 2 TIM barrel-domain containing protein n=1 Tax=Candidatus Pseudobacter hemicellulosilyticus TaxID=3121375 RepID=A0AAJ5WTQ9_9BACT|nr:MAG: glycoside hydrolase family 2 TIM barrel-domain containing protein [Pseudobacter sp.]